MLDKWGKDLPTPYDIKRDHKTEMWKFRKKILFFPIVIATYKDFASANLRLRIEDEIYYRDLGRFE